ncbi:aminotransferase class III-fold pyridoxal phosphate-dependent enzyme [Acidisoma cellulosilytica]|uniref:Aminotransferase class III-fold pyridoxal phosphate-dependent enzyme n=1 Tax=Acidisoma cellulosilyticum TaxID=2802395 RepID=A0A964E6T5_9PROT|nr:aminotransferase class III-fold pyridoxal phosphate-dependent enzyme [Acidisoma cellulosilyticum]MCB8883802.1 aminotransferase class III-fold pyridoxal phosphate-dependent enzyme [Acidisoma cellulosilyticum]
MHIDTGDQALRARALRVVPGGMYGHMRTATLPAGYPQFFERGEGCHIWDADGRRYLDFMCAWGPIVLGHRHPAVEEAVQRQMAKGDLLNGPTERMVELAERLVRLVAHADWALFAKNGTDATTTCVTLARVKTGRRKIVVAKGAYHGAVPWCSPSVLGVTAEDRAHLSTYIYNDIASLEKAVARAGDDLAGIVVSAFRHDYGFDQELPDPAFAKCARALADASGAALILDDVRAGFRLTLAGSWDLVDVQPDLSAWSKAIANGHALAAVTGNDEFRDAASQLFVTGSFWCGSVPMAAALATLDELERIDGPAQMHAMGTRLREGLAAQAAAAGIGIRQSGPPQMPTLMFEDDPDCAKGFLFCQEALKRGVYLHPRHNMFLSAAHTAADIDEALAVTREAFGVLDRS